MEKYVLIYFILIVTIISTIKAALSREISKSKTNTFLMIALCSTILLFISFIIGPRIIQVDAAKEKVNNEIEIVEIGRLQKQDVLYYKESKTLFGSTKYKFTIAKGRNNIYITATKDQCNFIETNNFNYKIEKYSVSKPWYIFFSTPVQTRYIIYLPKNQIPN